jgi:hypothetical protein
VNPVRFLDLDGLEPGSSQLALEVVAGEGAGDAACPLLHVAAGGLVHVRIGGHIRDREAPANLALVRAAGNTLPQTVGATRSVRVVARDKSGPRFSPTTGRTLAVPRW